MDPESRVNPYEPPLARSASPEALHDSKPAFGSILIIATAILLTCFLGYLLVDSPPDRWTSIVLSIIIPAMVGYAWTLRFHRRYALHGMAITGTLFLAVYSYLAYQPGIHHKPLVMMFALLSIPVLLAGVWTWGMCRPSSGHRVP